MGGWTDGPIDGWMDQQTDGWMDRQMDRPAFRDAFLMDASKNSYYS